MEKETHITCSSSFRSSIVHSIFLVVVVVVVVVVVGLSSTEQSNEWHGQPAKEFLSFFTIKIDLYYCLMKYTR